MTEMKQKNEPIEEEQDYYYVPKNCMYSGEKCPICKRRNHCKDEQL